jgi:hypothetical protein
LIPDNAGSNRLLGITFSLLDAFAIEIRAVLFCQYRLPILSGRNAVPIKLQRLFRKRVHDQIKES